MKRWLFIGAVFLPTASCTLGPSYRRPAVAMPSAYRDVAGATAEAGAASLAPLAPLAPLANVQWFDLFNDDMLTTLVRTALAQNFDLQICWLPPKRGSND